MAGDKAIGRQPIVHVHTEIYVSDLVRFLIRTGVLGDV